MKSPRKAVCGECREEVLEILLFDHAMNSKALNYHNMREKSLYRHLEGCLYISEAGAAGKPGKTNPSDHEIIGLRTNYL